jgi:hypothetical protein
MPTKKTKKQASDEQIIRNVKREMAKPRVAKSARIAIASDQDGGNPGPSKGAMRPSPKLSDCRSRGLVSDAA